MANIEALLGLHAGGAADLQALARRLRGQEQLGSALSLSTIPQVAALGAAERQGARAAAARGGTLRQTQAAREAAQGRWEAQRATEAERYTAAQRRADEQRAYERGRLGAPAIWANPETGEQIAVQLTDAGDAVVQGTEEPVPPGFLPVQPRRGYVGSQRGFKSKDEYGNNILTYPDGRVTFATGEPYDSATARRRAEAGAAFEAKAAGAKKSKQAHAVRRSDAYEEALSSWGGIQQERGELQGAVNALNEGAWTGAIVSQYLPTLTGATARLEYVQDRLAMAGISQNTFGSLSEAEADWLRFTALNTRQTPDRLKADVLKRLEGLRRKEAQLEYIMQELEQDRDPDPRTARDILTRDGFTFADPTEEEARKILAQAEGGTVNVSLGAQPRSREEILKQYGVE